VPHARQVPPIVRSYFNLSLLCRFFGSLLHDPPSWHMPAVQFCFSPVLIGAHNNPRLIIFRIRILGSPPPPTPHPPLFVPVIFTLFRAFSSSTPLVSLYTCWIAPLSAPPLLYLLLLFCGAMCLGLVLCPFYSPTGGSPTVSSNCRRPAFLLPCCVTLHSRCGCFCRVLSW